MKAVRVVENKIVSDLAKGMVVDGIRLAIRSGGLSEFSNKPGKYLRAVCGDSSGDILVIDWDFESNWGGESDWDEIKSKKVIEVYGKVDSYEGKLQIIATDIQIAEDYDKTQFIPKSNKDLQKMYDYLVSTVKKVSHRGYRNLLGDFLIEYKDKIFESVGAKSIHHDYIGGWLEHTYEVLKFVNTACSMYDVDKSLIRTGAILHDVGKFLTYDVGASIERNSIDYLVGHIPAGQQIIDRLIGINESFPRDYSNEDYARLMHIIYNHHDIDSEKAECLTLESAIIRKADALSTIANRIEKIKSEESSSDVYFDIFTKKQYYLK